MAAAEAGLEVLASVGESGARGESGGVPDGVGRAAGTRGERCAVTAGDAGSARTKLPAASREAAGLECAPARDEGRATAAAAAEAAEWDAVGVRGEWRDLVAASADVGGAEAAGERGGRRASLTASADAGDGRERGEQRAAVVAPAVRVVRGNPDDVEVAALLVALAAVGQAAGGGREDIAVPSPRRPLARFVPATSWRAR